MPAGPRIPIKFSENFPLRPTGLAVGIGAKEEVEEANKPSDGVVRAGLRPVPELNPADKDRALRWRPDDELVVLRHPAK